MGRVVSLYGSIGFLPCRLRQSRSSLVRAGGDRGLLAFSDVAGGGLVFLFVIIAACSNIGRPALFPR
jgi:hypothetical protein